MKVNQHTTESIEVILSHKAAYGLRDELDGLITGERKVQAGDLVLRLCDKLSGILKEVGR